MLRVVSTPVWRLLLLLLSRETSKGITLRSIRRSWTVKSILLLIDWQEWCSAIASHGLRCRLILLRHLLLLLLPKPLETIVRLVELDRIVCRESLELLLLLLLWHLSWLILIRLLPVLLLSATARIKSRRVFEELLPDGSASETIAKDASTDAL